MDRPVSDIITTQPRNPEDVDTCRICRGEGSDNEPLFHPCKCSGSIMYVHQECLMTWLSHSQKKHCELCKTNFRFTKLYSPHMPRELPAQVFLHRASLHIVGTFIYWLRGVFVAATWLVWLPWSMRFAWWALLWVADGGWATDALLHNTVRRTTTTQSPRPPRMTFSLFHALNITTDSVPRSRTLTQHIWNVLKGSYFGGQEVTPASDTPKTDNSTLLALNMTKALTTRNTLLSDFDCLNNLTSYPALNSFVIDVLEGQVITFSILIAVVLVFLIREWVVQQQPAVNWVPANDALQVAPEQQVVDEHDIGHEPNLPQNVARDEAQLPRGEPPSREDLEMPPPVFSNHEHDFPEGVEDDPPLWLAEDEALASLLNDLGRFHPELVQLAESSDVPPGASRPRKIAQDLVTHVYSTTIALGKACELAWAQSDFGRLQELHGRLDRLRNALEHLGDIQERRQLDARVVPTLLWVERLLEKADRPRPNVQASAVHAHISSAHMDIQDAEDEATVRNEQSNLSESNDGSAQSPAPADDHELQSLRGLSSSHARPNMPIRSESFLATEIQRTLEESSSGPSRQDPGILDGPLNERRTAIDRNKPTHETESLDEIGSTRSFSLLDYDSADPGPSQSADTMKLDHPSDSPGTNELMTLDEEVVDYQGSEGHHPEASTSAEDADQQLIEGGGNHGNEGINALSFVDSVCDWMWGDLPADLDEGLAQADEEVLHDEVGEVQMQFIEVAEDEQPEVAIDFGEGPAQGHENLEEAMAEIQRLNGNDADIANEDIEDLEGLLELIGMQGNILGLFQNAVFMAVVGSASITTAVWFPYLWGKLVLIFVANPLQVALRIPLELLSGMANFAIDVSVWISGSILAWVDTSVHLAWRSGLWLASSSYVPQASLVGQYSRHAAQDALDRISKTFLSHSDYMHLSASSHASLRALQAMFAQTIQSVQLVCVAGYKHANSDGLLSTRSVQLAAQTLQIAAANIRSLGQYGLRRLSWPANIDWSSAMNVQIRSSSSLTPMDPTLAVWSGTDRALAVLAGYGFFIILGAVYLTKLAPLSTTRQAKKVEEKIIDFLQQAGGIMKVIIIISIEMLVFPTYCGGLLDIATLPLFDRVSIEDRVVWTATSPWTSAFAHWFVGTCYMFHVALFVSMCRRIFRPGVIWFIRDPDDPTFHPVRDVLERNLASQLRKITFSAAVYGGLVSFFMGSVVWTLAMTDTGILPIRWSSSPGIKGFPIDLLLYTCLKPIVVKLWSPSSGLHTLYHWWFRQFAAYLRLRNFLLNGDAEADRKPWYLSSDGNSDPAGFRGRFVRVPNSDQARIPRGHPVFLEVDADNNRIDGKEDPDEGVHGRQSINFAKVYVPPFFRLRVFLFLVCMWILTAAIGLVLTVVPLITGRLVFSKLLPRYSHVNDIYSFVLGLSPVAAGLFFEPRLRPALTYVTERIPNLRSFPDMMMRAREGSLQAARVLYTYSALLLVLPSLLVLVLEFYIVGPAHAYYAGPREIHAVHIMQGWTLGIQYMRILKHVVEWNADSRPARALQAVLERGWLNPNVRLATRGFIVPITVSSIVALLGPLPIGWLASHILYAAEHAEARIQTIRFTYPALLFIIIVAWIGSLLLKALDRWRLRIRDEVYLIGERLHNFGEKRPPAFAHSSATRINPG